jgi:hypothetical protein
MLIAYYYPGDRNTHAAVDVYRLVTSKGSVEGLRGAERQHVETIEVSGKREARSIASAREAKPWNF